MSDLKDINDEIHDTSDDMTIVQFLRASGEHWDEDRYTAGADRIEALESALKTAEAALSDIGDADREEGDDLKWCENRAAKDLPEIRRVLNERTT
jgi:hypothetical protein